MFTTPPRGARNRSNEATRIAITSRGARSAPDCNGAPPVGARGSGLAGAVAGPGSGGVDSRSLKIPLRGIQPAGPLGFELA